MKRFGFDSRQSWEVLAACCVMKFMTFGLTEVAGILMVATMNRYQTTREAASLPYTLIYSIRNGAGPIIAYFGNVLGIRSATMLGCIISSLAITACFFAETILGVTIAWGIVFGVGFAFESLLLNAILIEHFKTNLSQAIGISTTGAILGTISFSPFVDSMVNKYGLSATFLLIAGVTLHAIPAALFMLFNRPNPNQQLEATNSPTELARCACGDKSSIIVNTGNRRLSVEIVDYVKIRRPSFLPNIRKHSVISEKIPCRDKELEIKSIYSENFIQNCTEKEMSVKIVSYKQCDVDKLPHISNNQNRLLDSLHQPINAEPVCSMSPNISMENPICQTCNSLVTKLRKFSSQVEALPSKIVEKLQSKQVMINLFKDPIYWLILLSGGLHYFTFPAFFTLLVDYAIDIGVDPIYSKYIVMYSVIVECFGALLLGWIADLGFVSSNGFAAICFLGECLAMIFIIFADRLIILALVIILFQWPQTGLTLIYPAVVSDSIDKTLQSSAIASMFLLAAPLDLLISPLVGFFRDRNGSYTGVYLTLAAAAILGSFFQFCVLKLVNKRNQTNKT